MKTRAQIAVSGIQTLKAAGFTRAGVSRAKGLSAAKEAMSYACAQIARDARATGDTHVTAAFQFVAHRPSVRSWADMEKVVVHLLNHLEIAQEAV